MAVMTTPRQDLDLLMRSAEQMLLVATDEVRLLDVATELLAEQYGYGARYVVLHDDQTGELYLGGAAGALADTVGWRTVAKRAALCGGGAPAALADPVGVRSSRRPDSAGLSGSCWSTGQVVNV